MKLHAWKTVSGLLFALGIATVGGGTGAELGCSSSSGDDGGGSGSGGTFVVPAGCSADDSLDCSGGGNGISCPSGTTPDDSAGICSSPSDQGDGTDGFCCIAISDSGCSQDDTVTGCEYPSYGFSCASGSADPSTDDPSLNCSSPTSDPNGNDDYCCADTGSGSGSGSGGGSSGGPPTGCTVDTSVDCSGGGDPYSCDSGDNPEAEDDTLSCSDSTPDADGVHDDFCCITFDGSSSSCVADDELDCTAGDAYGYQCDSGDDPTTLDSSLTCSDSTPDADGVHDDFCCNP